MSMTQIAFLKKADIPTNEQVQQSIQQLGYDFLILGDLKNHIDQNGLNCQINGQKTYFEVYFDSATEITKEAGWIRTDLTDQDTAVSFVWGADFAAGACIGLISIALIDQCNALVYYIDDQLRYTREMLVVDTPQFLSELEKENNRSQSNQAFPETRTTKSNPKKDFWERLKDIFK
jgi:hypothetical protein